MAIPQYDAAGDLLAWKLEHTAQQVDDTIDGLNDKADQTELDAEVSARETADNELKSAIDKVYREASQVASRSDNYWVDFFVANGGKVKVTNSGSNRITDIGVTTALYGANEQTFGNLNANESAVYTCSINGAKYMHFWATGATTVKIEDWSNLIPKIIDDIDMLSLPDTSKTIGQNVKAVSDKATDIESAELFIEDRAIAGNTDSRQKDNKVVISSNNQYFTVASANESFSFEHSSPLSLNSSSDITSIEIYKHYKENEIGSGKVLSVGDKTVSLYGTTQPSAAVWNAILFKSANWNGETYHNIECDYFAQYNGAVIQIRHVVGSGSEPYKQSDYGKIIRLEIPMEVVAVNDHGINIKNAIPSSASDCEIVDPDYMNLYYISSGDVVYAKGATNLTYDRYIDLLGASEIQRVKVISGSYQAGVIKPEYVSFISVYDVRESNKAYLDGYCFNTMDYYDLLDDDFNVISYLQNTTGAFVRLNSYEVDVSTASYLAVSNNNNAHTVKVSTAIKNTQEGAYIADKTNSVWDGRTVVWLGTSIPAAGGYIRDDTTASYPIKLARELGFDCHNLAIGGSCVHCKSPDRIAANNPYGFSNDFALCVKCITNTVEEMEWLIENYQSDIFTVNRYDSIDATTEARILATSYENMLPTIYAYNPDLIVFNYGWNDGADTLEQALAKITQYGDDTLYCYIGAMNFLLDKIFSHNPHQPVALIGEIREHSINEHEKYVAGKWLLPFYDLYNKCGFSSKTITTTGYWDANNIWIPSGGTEQQMYIYQTWLKDNVHPHSSSDGRALARITKCLIPFFMNDLRIVVDNN